MTLKEVGFWRDVRDDRDASGSSERTLLLHKSASIAAQSPEDEEDVGARPDPAALVDHGWYVTNPMLIKMLEWYLLDGAFVESYELAYSVCRFRKCSIARKDPKVMGACTMTDGVFVWPEGYWHYVRYHHVRPPQAFLDHVNANYRRTLVAAKALAREYGDDRLWLWNAETRGPAPMPAAMQEWILANTSLQLPGTKRSPPTGSQVWDLSSRMPSCCGCTIC